MRFLAITDLHGSLAALERIIASAGPIDAILMGGDITHFGSPEDAEMPIQRGRAERTHVLAVTGNCDSAEIEERLVQLGVSLHGRGVVLDGVGWHGMSAIPPWHRGMHQFTEEQLAEALRIGHAQLSDANHHCVLAHAPPHGLSVDRVAAGRHVGSAALREFIERAEPCLVVCGHVHEGRGVETLGPTTVVNCGPAVSGNYALIEADDEIRVELRRA
ncbi:MAG: metallophosphoesterase family protein [Planctomycetota bacterium]|jgi:Icc-related predicted phosphoesterase